MGDVTPLGVASNDVQHRESTVDEEVMIFTLKPQFPDALDRIETLMGVALVRRVELADGGRGRSAGQAASWSPRGADAGEVRCKRQWRTRNCTTSCSRLETTALQRFLRV